MSTTELEDILHALIFAKKGQLNDTKKFVSMEHDRDLLPKIEDRVHYIMTSLSSTKSITYDVQGPSDHGLDVLVKIEENGVNNFIGFQIKAQYEIVKDDFTPKLKAQFTDAYNRYGERLYRYFILLFGDYTNLDLKKRIAYNLNEFIDNKIVKVVDPLHLEAFSRITNIAIDSYFINRFSSSDYIYRKAHSNLQSMDPYEIIILIKLISIFVETGNKSISKELVTKNLSSSDEEFEHLGDFDTDRLLRAFTVLESNYFQVNENFIEFEPQHLLENVAQAYDFKARYQLEDGELYNYLINQVKDGLLHEDYEDDP